MAVQHEIMTAKGGLQFSKKFALRYRPATFNFNVVYPIQSIFEVKMKIRYPKHLKADGRKFYKKVLADFELSDGHDLERLALACECLDRITEARLQVETDGAFFTDRWGQPKEHPGQKCVRDNCVLFARLVREMCLDLEQPDDARPPRQY